MKYPWSVKLMMEMEVYYNFYRKFCELISNKQLPPSKKVKDAQWLILQMESKLDQTSVKFYQEQIFDYATGKKLPKNHIEIKPMGITTRYCLN